MKKIGILLVSSFVIAALLNCNVVNLVDAQSVQSIEITKIGQMDTAGWAANVQVQDHIAYLSASDAGLYIVNITNPQNPVELGRYNESIDDIHDIYIDGNLAYLADYTEGLKIVDVSDSENPTLIGMFNDGGEVGSVEIYGNFAFLADFQDGLEIVNITDPTHPQELLQYDTGFNYVFNVEVKDDLAYVSDFVSASEKALVILNISSLSSIGEIARYTIDGEIFSIDFVGDIAYMMCSSGGVKIFNISNPDSLLELSSYYDGGNAVEMAFFEDYMIIADRDIGLEVLTAGNLTSITRVGQYFDGGSATSIAVVNDLVFVTNGEDGFEVLQIRVVEGSSDPLIIELIIVSAGVIVVLGIVVFMRNRK
jgi:hypothetical protein